MKRRAVPPTTDSMVRVIPDSRDGRKDYWITREEAKKLHDEGTLDQDLTNSKYGHPLHAREAKAMMWMILVSMVTGTVGEIVCKRMASDAKAVYWLYPIVLICWGICGPLLWTHIYKTRGLAEGAVLYNVLQLVLVGCVGIIVFKEPLTPRFIMGALLAAAAIYVMQGGTK